MSRRLQIGCGARGRPAWVDLDRVPLPGVDVVADLDRPLPCGRFFCWWLPASEVAFEITLLAPGEKP